MPLPTKFIDENIIGNKNFKLSTNISIGN